MTCNVEHFSYAYMCIFFGEVFVKTISQFFFIALLVFLLLIFKSSLYVLDNSSLSDVSFANIFS